MGRKCFLCGCWLNKVNSARVKDGKRSKCRRCNGDLDNIKEKAIKHTPKLFDGQKLYKANKNVPESMYKLLQKELREREGKFLKESFSDY